MEEKKELKERFMRQVLDEYTVYNDVYEFTPDNACKSRESFIKHAVDFTEQEIDRYRLEERKKLKKDFLREFTNYGHDEKVRFLRHIPESDEDLIFLILDFFDGKRFYIQDQLTSATKGE